jgi:hypothetical protein
VEGSLDRDTFVVACPGCKIKHPKTLGWLKAHDQFICERCGRNININKSRFTNLMHQIDKAVWNLAKTVRRSRRPARGLTKCNVKTICATHSIAPRGASSGEFGLCVAVIGFQRSLRGLSLSFVGLSRPREGAGGLADIRMVVGSPLTTASPGAPSLPPWNARRGASDRTDAVPPSPHPCDPTKSKWQDGAIR